MPRAWLCRDVGAPITFEEVPAAAVGRGHIGVDVLTSGLDFVTTLLVRGKYQHRPPLPFVPGSEVIGTISEVGGGVTGYAVGDLVLVSTFTGGFQERLVCPARQATQLPPTTDLRRFPSLYGYQTALFALRDRARLRAGETLLVLGAAGGVGITAVELGKQMGATVIAAASTAAKLRTCREYGADHVVNYEEEDLKLRVRELTGGRGADVIYDPVGDRFTERAVRAMAVGARVLIVGFAAGAIPKLPANLFLLKNAQLVGSAYGEMARDEPARAAAVNADVLQMHKEGKLRPLTSAVYALRHAPQAMEDMAARRVQGKVLVVTDKFFERYPDMRTGAAGKL